MSLFWLEPRPLVLASKSVIRATVLRDAGLDPEILPSAVDERVLEASLIPSEATPSGVATALALAKAVDVSNRAPGRLVVGCDQTLSLDGERFTKPVDRNAGRSQLSRLSARTHMLASGVALARDGAALWTGVDEALLTMRPLSAEFIDRYLAAAGDGILASVGGYQYEGLGAHLFARVEGDTRTILGLPLLPLLKALRDLGAVAS